MLGMACSKFVVTVSPVPLVWARMIIPPNVRPAKHPKRFICSVLAQQKTISKGRIGMNRKTDALSDLATSAGGGNTLGHHSTYLPARKETIPKIKGLSLLNFLEGRL